MFEARIARGIGVLDRYIPGWRERVDPDRLDMGYGLFDPAAASDEESGCGCVLAQLDADPGTRTIGEYGHRLRLVCAMAGAGDLDRSRWAAKHGFELEAADHPADADPAVAYRQLTAEWRQALIAGPVAGGWSA